MSPIASGVLKHSRVRPGGTKPIVRKARPRASARVVEQDAQQAVIEVTCACGSVIRLRCGLGDAAPAAPAGS